MDPELITYFDERFRAIDDRFRETAQQIQGLRQETIQQIQALREETTHQIQELREETTQRFDQVDNRFNQVDERFERVEASGRHTNVLLEGLRHEVHLVAEGVYSLSQRLDSHKQEVAREFEDTRQRIERPYQDLNLRVRALEDWREMRERGPVDLIRERILNKKTP